MIRAAALIALVAGLAACKPAPDVDTSTLSVVSSQNTNDTRIAKEVFGYLPTPSQLPATPVGFYSNGCQAGAVALAETGPTWQAMRLSRNRNWGQPELVDFVQDLSRAAAQQPGWSGIYVGDMSQPRGGPMLSGHASHQIGLDADIWLKRTDNLQLTRQQREDISSDRMDRRDGAYVNDAWTPQHEAIVKAAASDPRVARIFIFAGAKVEMCRNATGDRSWLQKVRPWYGHNYHFHVRLNCPRGSTVCAPQDPPPAGDGCAEAVAWVNNLIDPQPAPPADPNAEPAAPPRGELRMSSLPAQCAAVAAN
ncbi:penicillin-insensitive murein endopeptidase [Loktanella fryxellensis]|uniref:Penicillin-insensitive murein endopeptidase n=1 Tax=Loktanella fryxellensis TaxID=245187 RepID=A0A1H8J1Y6_9RHOB|nr:penicillin-insensitive murein endopeptidase [Loktanella fryxellensis]SEN74691.1 penicillin-insensitive murein endopeptidase [Loktanella fryxellensis]